MEKFLNVLAKQDGCLSEFDSDTWTALVDFVTVGKDGTVAVTFKNGVKVTA